MKNNPILYILMRNDLQSLNPGKAMAQASHATNLFMADKNMSIHKLRQEWLKQTTQSFGTVLVLSANHEQLKTAVAATNKLRGMFPVSAGIVVDPTYPYNTTQEVADLIPSSYDAMPRAKTSSGVNLWRAEPTCGYVFGDKGDLHTVVGKLSLHP